MSAHGKSFHQEETQIMSKQPPAKALQSGFLPCVGCGKDMELNSFAPLSITPCPSCGTQNFIPQKIKDYWLYEPLGGGGMGSVYHAFLEHDPEIELAVKILPRQRKNEAFLIQALLCEARIGYHFGDHPHLVKIIDMGYSDGEYFEAMEYVEGIRLARIIESPVKRPEKQILLWALQILSAEQHMFEKGYLFRDLKPQNIIIDNNGNVKLFDFGLAITLEEALNLQSDEIQGSPHYIPPERIVGAGESLCSEIYSLGMLLFHMLARQTYYSSAELELLMAKHVTALRVGNVAGKLPSETNQDIVRVLNRMINRTPRERYQTYCAAAADLMRIYKMSA